MCSSMLHRCRCSVLARICYALLESDPAGCGIIRSHGSALFEVDVLEHSWLRVLEFFSIFELWLFSLPTAVSKRRANARIENFRHSPVTCKYHRSRRSVLAGSNSAAAVFFSRLILFRGLFRCFLPPHHQHSVISGEALVSVPSHKT